MNDTSINPDAVLDKVAENIRAREYALEVVGMCGMQPQRFWECLKSLCENRYPSPPPTVEKFPAMDERNAQRFEKCTVPYGVHRDKEVGIVPVDYLLFIAEGDEFSRNVKMYVKSKRFESRQESED